MSLRVLDDFLDLPVHRIKWMVRAIQDAISSGPSDRFAKERQPSNARAVHVDVFTPLCDFDHLSHSLDQSGMAHNNGQLGKIFGNFPDPFWTGIFSQTAMEQNRKAMVLCRLHERIDFFFVVRRAM